MKEFVCLFLITVFAAAGTQAGELKSRYLRTTKEDLQKFYSKRYQKTEKKVRAKKPSRETSFPHWSDFGKIVGEIDNYVIIKTKDGNYLIKRDWRE